MLPFVLPGLVKKRKINTTSNKCVNFGKHLLLSAGPMQFSALTCLPFWTNAWKRSHSINASRSISTGGSEAIVNVLAAVVPAPTIDADTGVASVVVGAGTSILTSVGLELTFINIFSAKLAWCTERNRFNKSSDTRRFLHRQHNQGKCCSPTWLPLIFKTFKTANLQHHHCQIRQKTTNVHMWPQVWAELQITLDRYGVRASRQPVMYEDTPARMWEAARVRGLREKMVSQENLSQSSVKMSPVT